MREILQVTNISNEVLSLDGVTILSPGEMKAFSQPLSLDKINNSSHVYNMVLIGDVTISRYVDNVLETTYDASNVADMLQARLSDIGGGNSNATLLTSGTLADARLSANVPLKNATSNTFTGGIISSTRIVSGVVAITDQATLLTDASLGNVFTVTIAASRTMAAPTNPTSGQKIVYQIKQGTGSKTITWNSAFRFSANQPPALTTTINKTDYIGFIYNAVDSKWDCIAERLNF